MVKIWQFTDCGDIGKAKGIAESFAICLFAYLPVCLK
jgi:hypothetical protein